MKTTGHTVLITGGATGIGLALATKFHAAGNRVILVGRTASALTEAARTLPGAEFCVANVAEKDDRDRLLLEYSDANILINNAGVRFESPVANSSPEDLRFELEVNFLAPVLLTQAFLPMLKNHSGAAVINVTSGLALAPREVAAMYNASKAAMHSFSKALRWQLEASKVKVFEVLPPKVDTAMTAHHAQSKGKISPSHLAEEFWQGFQDDRYEMLIGQTKVLAALLRLSPRLVDRIMRKNPAD